MKKHLLVAGILLLSVVLFVKTARAGVPFNNLQGAGGVAFNPLAYLADSDQTLDNNKSPLGKPRFGFWYVNLPDVDVDWTTFGVADTLFHRVELSYGREVVAPDARNIYKDDIGAKVLLVKENAGGNKFVPAVSVGAVWQNTSRVGAGVDSSGADYYLVATKLITQLPKPLLVSAGVISSNAYVQGVFGYDDDHKTAFFGNVDLLPLKNLAVGVEYRQGTSFNSFKNADYWDAHLGWLVNNNLSLIAAYVNAGNYKSATKVGLGEGLVLSAQYSF